MNQRLIVIDPSYEDFYGNVMFDASSPLNRDNSFSPGIKARETARRNHTDIETADQYWNRDFNADTVDYYSFGLLNDFKLYKPNKKIQLKGFFICEPPVVQPQLYQMLPKLTQRFEKVYVYNTEGDGYSLKGVDQTKLAKYFFPQPFNQVLDLYWNRADRYRDKIVVINGNRVPKSKLGELYSKRIQAMVALEKYHPGSIDLYGMKWNSWKTRSSFWLPYLIHRTQLLKLYRGSCPSKYEVLSRYLFSLCFENMAMKGYITEKLFDCLYAGTVPIYLGAKDIECYIPKEVYIDGRQFSRWEEIAECVQGLSMEVIQRMREAGKKFIASHEFKNYYDSLEHCFELPME